MIRFPNPGTDVDAFIETFKIIYADLNKYDKFDLDMISSSMAKSNRAASEGNIGTKALSLSTRDDRSRDPMYNNSKMYAELYRTLGWISSTPDSNLEYRFTFLGEHVGSKEIDSRLLFDECLFGINYPNKILKTKSKASSRTMAVILKCANKLGGYITRDEIIIGPMNMDESIEGEYDRKIGLILKCRQNHSIDSELERMKKEQNTQINTMRNYTRFPISVLTTFGYFDKKSPKELGLAIKDRVVYVLTDKGKKKIEWLDSCFDVRLNTLENMNQKDFDDLIRLGFFELLSRSNFKVDRIDELRKGLSPELDELIDNRPVLFSPYQTLAADQVDEALNVHVDEGKISKPEHILEKEERKTPQRSSIKLRSSNQIQNESKESWVSQYIEDGISRGDSDQQIADSLFKQLEDKNKGVFYETIANLFCILGFDCHATRSGINYERWDAMIKDPNNSIPIEIKSPREERFISIKAIRQALENKIVLLSRKSYPTNYDTISLAVGYCAPNKRAEVESLIEDISKTYGIHIGVVDTYTLIELAIKSKRDNFTIDKTDFITLKGVLNAGDL